MKHPALLIAAVALLLVGAAGIAVLLLTTAGSATLPAGARFTSNGQSIYYTGADVSGPIARSIRGGGMMGFGMTGAFSCVDCHGEDGRGGKVSVMMFGSIDVPDIRYSTLSTARVDNGSDVPAWTDADIARAIRNGVEPTGQRLKAPMPRWNMTDADLEDVIAYLKELSSR